jgi:hypothetical protein
MKKRMDLHIHTTMSDGAYTPKEVIDEAYENGVQIISITDHDTVEAYDQNLIDYAKSKNITLINGVEISTKSKKVGIHILGYNFNIKNEEFQSALRKIRNIRHDYLHDVADKLSELGYVLNVNELDKIDAVTKAHIALDVVNNEKNKELLIQTFNRIPNKGEFIETIMNEGCPAYAIKRTVSPKEAAEIIRKANGKVVLAHPIAYAHEDGLTDKEILEIVEDIKPDGIEANYLYVNYSNNVIDETKKWNKFASDNNLFVTIGSDFHNKVGARPYIGFTNTNFMITEDEIKDIVNTLLG